MNNLRKDLGIVMAFLIAIQPMLITVPTMAQIAPQSETRSSQQNSQYDLLNSDAMESRGIELTGFLEPRAIETRSTNEEERELGEDGSPAAISPLANLPVLDEKLQQKIATARFDESLRVILHLAYQPHVQIFREVESSLRTEIDALENDRLNFLAALADKRDLSTKIDAHDYASTRAITDSERVAQRALGERNEALSSSIKAQVITQLKSVIDANQAPIVEELKALGAEVEFSTIAGNMIIAKVPAGRIDDLAKIDGVSRVVEDSMMEGHLNNAASATMVNPSDASLLGLWDNTADGGIYDPAIIDSGVDQNHPGMRNSVAPLRDNFCSWYLVAANGSSSFGDEFSCDDLQGHGTHVAGIVGSYGTPVFPNHLGMAFGVEKQVNLKAGWLNSSSGRASMFWSDKYFLVDRALNTNNQLIPSNFLDDVDGFNLSYGGSTSLDDTDGSRFWDSVISTYADTPVTISAGNSGPNNTLFYDPAISYNAITVANYNDRGTVSLADDIINSGSTVGPTANGRRKPDLAAPGTSISAPNHDWEVLFTSDYVPKTGTSMAAPMVLGVIMDLMDASVFDELTLKALLINTAQKNRPGMNIENDADGWDPALGFGAMNAYAAYYHRFDVFKDFLEPRDLADNHESGDYQLYAGTMQDEGAAGEGRDRATMVWNRTATYLADSAPSTYFTLPDVNLRLYNETNNALIDFEVGVPDNVHQVRINSGAPETPVVVKAYTWSSSFAHGGATEEIAVAVEEGFTRVDFPTQFQGIAQWPTIVEPNEVFDITFWLRNDSDIASHNNTFNLELPAGWTLLAGIDTQNAGSAQVGGITNMVTYTIRAPAAVAAAQSVVVKHSHNSYLESYGDFNWNMSITVEVDNTPPNPNPMTFSIAPDQLSTSQMDMQAQFATDLHSPVQYRLEYTGSTSGGSGGNSSGWQSSRDYVDSGLAANHRYCYRALARDNAAIPNPTAPSGILCAYTAQQFPASTAIGAITTTSINVSPSGSLPNLTLGSSGVRLRNTTLGTLSGWQSNFNSWTSVGLLPARAYSFTAQARNGDADVTLESVPVTRHTLANPPAIAAVLTVSDTEIKVSINANGNGAEAEYYIENTSAGTNSGWMSDFTWASDGLECDTLYSFQARARNGEGVETIIVPFGVQSTDACSLDTDGDGIEDSADNCTLIANANQRDTNGDGYGNVCDPDLNNDGTVNFIDISMFGAVFPSTGVGLDADFNGDNAVNFLDFVLFNSFFLDPPGPSGVAP